MACEPENPNFSFKQRPDGSAMIRSMNRLFPGVLAVCVSITAADAAAQSTRQDSIQAERNCVGFEARLLNNNSSRHDFGYALQAMEGCPDLGPALITRLWRQAPADTTRLGELAETSVSLRDTRILETVRAVAADRARPTLVRAWAVTVIGHFAEPQYFAEYQPGSGGRLVSTSVVAGSRLKSVNGKQPFVWSMALKLQLGAEMKELSKKPGEDPFMAEVFRQLGWKLTGTPT